MKLRQLGKSEMRITPVGIGAWAMGGGNWEFAWGPQEDNDSIDAIYEGLDRGLNWIDTAAAYGLGHSEKVVGRAIADMDEPPYVFTKGSLVWDETGAISHNLQGASIRREVEGSLHRLGVERIDLYQIHWPAWKGVPEGTAPGSVEEALSALVELQRQGKIRHIGVSNFDTEQLARAQSVATITSLQPPYSLLDREVEKTILPYAQQHQIGVIVYSPMHSGLLSGAMSAKRIAGLPQDDWRRNSTNFKEPALTRNLQLVEVLRSIGNRHKVGPGQVAVAWTLHNPAVTGAIVGMRTAQQAREMAVAADFRLSEEEVQEIENWWRQKAA